MAVGPFGSGELKNEWANIDKCTIFLKMYIQNESAPRIPSVSVHSFSLIYEIHGNAEEWFVLFWFGRLCRFSKFSRLILNIKLSLASRCPYLPILVK
jgi:hypothetical protein